MRAACSHRRKRTRREARVSSAARPEAAGPTPRSARATRSTTSFPTPPTPPAARPAARTYCPRSASRPLRPRRPHPQPRFPAGGADKFTDTQDRPVPGRLPRKGGLAAPAPMGAAGLLPAGTPPACYPQTRRSVSSCEQKHSSASFSSYWLFSGHMLSCCALQVAFQFFYFSSCRNSVLNVKEKFASLFLCTSNQEIPLV